MITPPGRDLSKDHQAANRVKYGLGSDGAYRIDGYDEAPAFSSFLPGIGGPDGVPLWCMYVNRGQAVVSFGVINKDNAIAEFLPATSAYQLVGVQGFRTFCRIDGEYYEPFKNDAASGNYDYSRYMCIEADRVSVSEVNHTLGLSFDVEYLSPVNQPIGSLIRVITISNVSSKPRRLVALDGLALVLPAGLTDIGVKTMRRMSEAYANVRLICGTVPFYAAKAAAHDEAEVSGVRRGHFYAAWIRRDGRLTPVEPFVDPTVIFGDGHDLITPRRFIHGEAIDRKKQVWENRLPCALAPLQAVLESGESLTLVAVAGASPIERMVSEYLSCFTCWKDITAAFAASRDLINSLVAPAFAVSDVPALGAYARQNYLDNVLRGGIPLLLPSQAGPTPLHLYSRRHGDLERDYNEFMLPPHPLSSGAGNYRDICQNRRSDIWFYPDLRDEEIRFFVELLQADGYNPLSVEGYHWVLDKEQDPLQFCPTQDEHACMQLTNLLERGFHPGELLAWANACDVDVGDRLKWLEGILQSCDRELIAGGHEGGYWIDHWTYIVDLLEAFASIFPDRVEETLGGRADIKWFDEGAYVVPRSEKYVPRSTGSLQLNAVVPGSGSAVPLSPVTVFGKLCALLALKAVSFDYECRGVEMEAGRPGWNDSLNGLPSLSGSCTCETAATARLATWLREHLPSFPDTVFPVEVADLIDSVVEDLQANEYCWDRAATIREGYRERLRSRVSGHTRTVCGRQLETLLTLLEERARGALERAIDADTGLVHTYYMNRPGAVKEQGDKQGQREPMLGDSTIVSRREPLPLYLEGQVHLMRSVDNKDRARQIYDAVRASPLFDPPLKMYKLNECLDACPPEIGRARTFTRGWFENESIWLHMSYKYLLELLRAGLYEEFFEDGETMLVPFMNPEVYGRSILENSSFLASSANPDPSTHGRGFVARLSGSTAEFISMWLLLTVGEQPFYVERGELGFRLKPVLPGKWFTRERASATWNKQSVDIPKGSFACAIMGTTLLVYHNDSRKDTFGESAVKPASYLFDEQLRVDAPRVGAEIAERIRRREYGRIDVWLE